MHRVRLSKNAIEQRSADGLDMTSPVRKIEARKVAGTTLRPSGIVISKIANPAKAMNASSRFEAGPARLTSISSRLKLRKLRLTMGTGLAHPKRKPPKKLNPKRGPKIIRAGRPRGPTGSMG